MSFIWQNQPRQAQWRNPVPVGGQGKKRFRWRLPEGNPYLRTETRNTYISRYSGSGNGVRQRLNGEPDALKGARLVRGGEAGN